MSVSVETNPTFNPGTPELVLEGDYLSLQGGRTYEVSPDGERFLIIKPIDSSDTETKIIVVTNWFEELNRIAPPSEPAR